MANKTTPMAENVSAFRLSRRDVSYVGSGLKTIGNICRSEGFFLSFFLGGGGGGIFGCIQFFLKTVGKLEFQIIVKLDPILQ